MTGRVVDIQTGETISDIRFLLQQTWPKNREKGDYRKIIREQGDLDLRVTICAFCGAESPQLDGPTGRAWFASHQCKEIA